MSKISMTGWLILKHDLFLHITDKESKHIFPIQASTNCNVSGYRCESKCRSRGREFDTGPVPYFHGD